MVWNDLAVEALGRSQDFDTKKDSVVRVEVHRLRKRLQEYYHNEGARHTIQITIPPGQYAPKFVYLEELAVSENKLETAQTAGPLSLEPTSLPVATPLVVKRPLARIPWLLAIGFALAVLRGVGLSAYLRPNPAASVSSRMMSLDLPGIPGDVVRILAGATHSYQDSNG